MSRHSSSAATSAPGEKGTCVHFAANCRTRSDGSAEAASLLGKIYDEGIMGKVNYDKAFRYYLLAAERGDSGAMLMTGMFYASGTST